MAMPIAERWTKEMLATLPDDGNRYEIIDGQLFVTPAPRLAHQRAQIRLAFEIGKYLDAEPVAEIFVAPVDIDFSDDTVVEPDIVVLPLRHPEPAQEFRDVGRLLLAVEVLSPSTARVDRGKKRRLYQRENVAEYWIVDADARTIERWRPGDVEPEILTDRLSWHPEEAGAAMELELSKVFK